MVHIGNRLVNREATRKTKESLLSDRWASPDSCPDNEVPSLLHRIQILDRLARVIAESVRGRGRTEGEALRTLGNGANDGKNAKPNDIMQESKEVMAAYR